MARKRGRSYGMPQMPPKHPPLQHGVPPAVQVPPDGMQLAMSGGG